MMKVILAVLFYFLYWGACYLATGTDQKNLIGLRSYPDAVQARVRSEPALSGAAPKEPSPAAICSAIWFYLRLCFPYWD